MNKIAIYAKFIYYEDKIIENSYLLINGKKIEKTIKVLPENIKNDYKIIYRSNSAIFPGFINTHTHLPMVFFRGLADDLPLMEWLKKYIWPAENKWLSDEFVYDATLLAACELIKNGTVCANDMYFYSDSIAQAMIKVGMKGVVGAGVLDFPTKFAKNSEDYLDKAKLLIEKYNNNELIRIAICPHAPYTVSPENYKKCVAFAEKYDLIIHTHLAETEWEVEEIYKKYSKTPLQLMNEIGMLDTKSIFAHMVHLSDEEIELSGEKHINISHCLESNLKLASGFAKIKKLHDAGANISIGTDGAASNNDLDILAEVSVVSKFHKAYSNDATAINAKTALYMITINSAKGLYIENTGQIKEGNFADLIIVDLNKCHLQPLYNPVSQLIYAAKSSDITDVFINGNHVMENRKIITVDEEEILDKAKYWGKKISEV
ncbi:amidohydrolase family protein [Deferribacter abyssi]|uniref:amidohydrolase family protein n=1 Tax=Deferribacter abyssi TaxID=213806 RepID=UPI003C230F5E